MAASVAFTVGSAGQASASGLPAATAVQSGLEDEVPWTGPNPEVPWTGPIPLVIIVVTEAGDIVIDTVEVPWT
ncbi:hypothetical protein ACGFYQ_37070 [Streptomyces sp. NPDC048258]|uniref:hypothetical protein n=1 Tax=Streptomyces sp. NPDC048258 TaxID=3365527 RepID=UPI0037108179